MNILEKIFQTKHPVIAMIHFPPLIGYKDYPGIDEIKEKTLEEVEIINKCGFHGIMVENNYDIPHKEFVNPEITAMITELTGLTIRNTSLPVGIDVLWNDFKSSLGICGATGAKFIRVPAFVDSVKTLYGIMKERSKEVIKYRNDLGLNNVAIFSDVQVKHSEMIDKNKPLSQSINEAFADKADAIIVTGKWTGDAPKDDDLNSARKAAGEKPILIGSGSTSENLKSLLSFADGVIVGTAIMTDRKVDLLKSREFISAYKSLNL